MSAAPVSSVLRVYVCVRVCTWVGRQKHNSCDVPFEVTVAAVLVLVVVVVVAVVVPLEAMPPGICI